MNRWHDPIVEEVRRIRDQQAAELNYDLAAIFERARRRQRQSKRRPCRLPTLRRPIVDAEDNLRSANLKHRSEKLAAALYGALGHGTWTEYDPLAYWRTASEYAPRCDPH